MHALRLMPLPELVSTLPIWSPVAVGGGVVFYFFVLRLHLRMRAREHFQLGTFRFGGWLSPGFNQPITQYFEFGRLVGRRLPADI